MTAQMREVIIYNGEECSMATCPGLPHENARVTELDESEMMLAGFLGSTACWRKYVGTWEIIDDVLYLIYVEGRYKLTEGAPLKADWFSGVIRIPRGKILKYIHIGFASIYEEEILLQLESGIVCGVEIIDNRLKEFNALGVVVENK